MERLRIDIPISDAWQPGDVADVTLNGVPIAKAIDMVPGQLANQGHVSGSHLLEPHILVAVESGHASGWHLADPHLSPRRYVTIQTDPMYFGLYTVEVQTADRLGNTVAGNPPTLSLFVNTGPQSPTGIRFGSQSGSGPITFSFNPSPELAT